MLAHAHAIAPSTLSAMADVIHSRSNRHLPLLPNPGLRCNWSAIRPGQAFDAQVHNIGTPALEFELNAGDAAYIPRGVAYVAAIAGRN